MLKFISMLTLSIILSALALAFSSSAMAKDVMLMNGIGPSQSELYVADADGTREHKLLAAFGFDYHSAGRRKQVTPRMRVYKTLLSLDGLFTPAPQNLTS